MKTIPLTRGLFAIVDDDIYEMVGHLNWYAQKSKFSGHYATRSVALPGKKNQSRDYLHWYALGQPMHGLEIDHINGNPLDNRRGNIRIVSRRMNALNRKCHRSGKHIGSRFMKGRNRWVTSIRVNGDRKYIGCFETEEEASAKYKQELLKVA